MSEGLLDAIFATSTVAAGVDFPARTVAFLNSDRFNGREFLPLDRHRIAADDRPRRPARQRTASVSPWWFRANTWMCARWPACSRAPPADVYSQIRINFSMTLNLLLSHTPAEVEICCTAPWPLFSGMAIPWAATRRPHPFVAGFPAACALPACHRFCRRTTPADRGRPVGRKLRIDQPLLVAEGLRLGLFPQTDAVLLAAIIASMVNDKETDEHLDKKALPEPLVKAVNRVGRGLRGFAKHMQARGFEARPLYLKPAAAVFNWAHGRPWDKAVEAGQMAEGDLAMLALRTADNLRHVVALKNVFPQVAETAKYAVERILRDPVVADHPPAIAERPPDPAPGGNRPGTA
jgi:ATP-dependent RNA helicase HelY